MFEYRAQVLKITDGDTVVLSVDLGFHTHRVEPFRVLGINTPEIRGDERPLGLQAKREVGVLLPYGSKVKIRTEKQDKYGRYLCSIELHDGTDLATHLLEGGWALPYDGRGSPPRFDPSAPYPLPVG